MKKSLLLLSLIIGFFVSTAPILATENTDKITEDSFEKSKMRVAVLEEKKISFHEKIRETHKNLLTPYAKEIAGLSEYTQNIFDKYFETYKNKDMEFILNQLGSYIKLDELLTPRFKETINIEKCTNSYYEHCCIHNKRITLSEKLIQNAQENTKDLFEEIKVIDEEMTKERLKYVKDYFEESFNELESIKYSDEESKSDEDENNV